MPVVTLMRGVFSIRGKTDFKKVWEFCEKIGKTLVGCVLRPNDSEVIQRRHPHLLSLANDVKLGFYTVPTGNRTQGRRVENVSEQIMLNN